MKVLICGDRNWKDREKIRQRLVELPKGTEIIHGGCRGADQIAESVAMGLLYKNIASTEVFYADWETYGRAAGPIRNREMVDDLRDGDMVLAFHSNLKESKGTRDTLRRAKERGIKAVVVT